MLLHRLGSDTKVRSFIYKTTAAIAKTTSATAGMRDDAEDPTVPQTEKRLELVVNPSPHPAVVFCDDDDEVDPEQSLEP